MKGRVLIICYYFPPLGLGGVARPVNLLRYLPDFGYDCDVLTVKPVAYRKFEPELLQKIDTDRVYRSGSRDMQRILYLLGMRTLPQKTIDRGRPVADRMFPDSKQGWIDPAVKKATRLLGQKDYSVIISTSPPVSAHVVGMRLAERSGLPWIADFRDFWSMYRVEHTYADARLIDRANELRKQIVAASSVVTAVNKSIIDYLGEGEVITNGYDPERARLWELPGPEDKFSIGMPGNLNEARVVEPLLGLLTRIRERSADHFARLRLVQVGQVDTDWFSALLGRYGLEEKCTTYSFQERDQTIGILSKCSMFYIGLTAGQEQGILPQRLFDLAPSGRPILAYVAEESEIAHYLESIDNGFRFDNALTGEAADYIVARMDSDAPIRLHPEYADKYSAQRMAERYAELIDRIL